MTDTKIDAATLRWVADRLTNHANKTRANADGWRRLANSSGLESDRVVADTLTSNEKLLLRKAKWLRGLATRRDVA